MIPSAERLLEKAQKGEILSARERRHCVAYLTASKPEVTQSAMAELFKVSERMIRKDRETLRSEKAKAVKQEDIGLVIADIAICFDRQVRDLEVGKAKAKPGSNTFLSYCKAIFDLQLKKVTALQELGYYPKNLGNLVVDKFEFKAVVNSDGSVTARKIDKTAVEEDEPGKVVDVEAVEVKPIELPPPDLDSMRFDAAVEKELDAV